MIYICIYMIYIYLDIYMNMFLYSSFLAFTPFFTYFNAVFCFFIYT